MEAAILDRSCESTINELQRAIVVANAGVDLYARGQDDLALRHYGEAVRIRIDMTLCKSNACNCCDEQNRRNRLEDTYESISRMVERGREHHAIVDLHMMSEKKCDLGMEPISTNALPILGQEQAEKGRCILSTMLKNQDFKLIYNTALIYLRSDIQEEALKLFRYALDLLGASNQYIHIGTECLHHIGRIYYLSRRYHVAIATFQEALQRSASRIAQIQSERGTTEQVASDIGQLQRFMARVLVCLSLSHVNLGQCDSAINYCHQALALQTQSSLDVCQRSVDVSITLGVIGFVHEKNGDKRQARRYKDAFLKLAKTTKLDRFSEEVSSTLHDIGGIFYEDGNLDEALAFYVSALRTRKKVSGKHDVEVAKATFGIAEILNKRKEYADALRYYYEALNVQKLVLGETHEESINTLCCIGHAQRNMFQIKEATDTYRDAILLLSRKRSETSHRQVSLILQIMGMLSFEVGEESLGLAYTNEAAFALNGVLKWDKHVNLSCELAERLGRLSLRSPDAPAA